LTVRFSASGLPAKRRLYDTKSKIKGWLLLPRQNLLGGWQGDEPKLSPQGGCGILGKKLEERDQVRISGIVVQDSLTLGQFVEKWMREKVQSRLSPSTQANYESDLRLHLLPFLKDQPLRSLRLEHGNQIVLHLQGKGRSPKTINGVLGLLQGILNDAVFRLLKPLGPWPIFSSF